MTQLRRTEIKLDVSQKKTQTKCEYRVFVDFEACDVLLF